jgi:hypothetical protein
MRDPLGQDLPQMPLIERNEMVETFATRRSDQSFAKRVRLRDASRCFQHAKPHRPQGVVNRGGKHGIAIVHHEAVRFVAGQDASELLRRPLHRRMLRDIPMQNPTGADLQHHEHVDEPERGRNGHEEIARQRLASVVPHKRAPGLRRCTRSR